MSEKRITVNGKPYTEEQSRVEFNGDVLYELDGTTIKISLPLDVVEWLNEKLDDGKKFTIPIPPTYEFNELDGIEKFASIKTKEGDYFFARKIVK